MPLHYGSFGAIDNILVWHGSSTGQHLATIKHLGPNLSGINISKAQFQNMLVDATEIHSMGNLAIEE